MADFKAYEYKLRAGSPMFNSDGAGFLHTFMAEKYEVNVRPLINGADILNSNDFSGQGGDYVSATYNRFKDKTGDKFNGREVRKPVYIDESELETL